MAQEEQRQTLDTVAAADPGEPHSPTLRGRTLGLLYLAGATIGGVGLTFPHSAEANDFGLWTNVAIAYVAGALLLLFARRLPSWVYHLAIAAGTLIISRAMYLSGDPASFYVTWYMWVGLFAFYFFSRIAAVVHVVLVGVAYAALLIRDTPIGAEVRWLTTMTTLVVAGVFMDMLVRRIRRHALEAADNARNLAAIGSAMREASRRTGADSARTALCEAALAVSGAKVAALWEPTRDGTGLEATAGVGAMLSETVLPFVGPLSGATRAFGSGDPFFVSEASDHPDVHQDFVERIGATSCLYQPVIRDEVAIAVLAVYWPEQVAHLSDRVATAVGLLAAEVGSALERADLLGRLEEAARTDDLTGLPNRRAWQEELPRELARARRDQRPLCVAMIDLDAFKAFNDSLGHQAGDRLLKQTAAAWKTRLRVTDTLVRYGGDEFAALLPACELEDALDLLERLREVTPASQTCSAGVALWDTKETPDQLVARSDTALYEAKRTGRDRVVVAAESPPRRPA